MYLFFIEKQLFLSSKLVLNSQAMWLKSGDLSSDPLSPSLWKIDWTIWPNNLNQTLEFELLELEERSVDAREERGQV